MPKGVLLALGGVIAICILGGLDGALTQSAFVLPVVLGIGLTQWIALLPLALWIRKRGEAKTVQGILITGGIVFLLNATCWGLFAGFRLR
ncbi:MAG TPA: hypothetical protein VH325_19255 [Bryobacteraceae bacterium]|nr:hypothetical protein [Bryobacteraceae bacterium]